MARMSEDLPRLDPLLGKIITKLEAKILCTDAYADCEECEGEGEITCDTCEGEGTVERDGWSNDLECHTSDDATCPDCEGTPVKQCCACDGEGRVEL